MAVNKERVQIISFYCFKKMSGVGPLRDLRLRLRSLMAEFSIKGTIILADEGFNATISGFPEDIDQFYIQAEFILGTKINFKTSFHDGHPFRRVEVKIKPEIVTLKKDVDISLGSGTHVGPAEWNRLISDAETIVIDIRNNYEFRTGTFSGAINPATGKFSDLPRFVEERLDPARHNRIAMFCTGGIRCEKFAPYMKSLGFKEVYQLEGGILKYLEEVSPEQSLWAGECFVFDERVSVSEKLEKGASADLSASSFGPAKR